MHFTGQGALRLITSHITLCPRRFYLNKLRGLESLSLSFPYILVQLDLTGNFLKMNGKHCGLVETLAFQPCELLIKSFHVPKL